MSKNYNMKLFKFEMPVSKLHVVFVVIHDFFFKFHESEQKQHGVYKLRHFYHILNFGSQFQLESILILNVARPGRVNIKLGSG